MTVQQLQEARNRIARSTPTGQICTHQPTRLAANVLSYASMQLNDLLSTSDSCGICAQDRPGLDRSATINNACTFDLKQQILRSPASLTVCDDKLMYLRHTSSALMKDRQSHQPRSYSHKEPSQILWHFETNSENFLLTVRPFPPLEMQ